MNELFLKCGIKFIAMNKPLVSVVIPIYNVQDYVERCVDSIINQTYTNLEIILVNDGSTDKSLERIQKYSDRCIIIDKKNGGLSSARNAGIKKSTGKYLCFVDSDDYLERNALEILINEMILSQPDFCCFRFFTKNQEGKQYIIGKDFQTRCYTERSVIIKAALTGSNIKTSVCSKLYMRSLITDNNIQFVEGTINEDAIFTAMVAACATKVSFINIPLYFVEQRRNSISRNYRNENVTSYFTVLQNNISFYKSRRIDEEYSLYLLCQYAIGILYTLVSIAYNVNSYKLFYHDYYSLLNKDNYNNNLIQKSTKLKGLPYYILALLSRNALLFYIAIKLLKICGIKRYN